MTEVGKKMSGSGNKDNSCGKNVTRKKGHVDKFAFYSLPKLGPRDYSLGGLNRREIQSCVA